MPPPPPPSVSNEHSARSPFVGLRRMDQTLSKTDCIACYVDLIRGLIMYNDLKGTAHSAQKKYFEASLSTKHIFLFGTEKKHMLNA